jgi:HEPN domain-containing protein
MDESSISSEQVEVAGVLLERAQSDLRAADKLAEDAAMDDDVVGFHAQQAVEKSLKVALVVGGIDFPKTHDLDFLVSLAERNEISMTDDVRTTRWLSPWAAEFRYDIPSASPLDRAKALAAARSAVDWARAALTRAVEAEDA